ncbi:ABC transporter ATP-binding protein [Nonomuraea harbinensis]|uniref:ABC transporter ATP-binding protein n=1 Tax=Nonomuraea harbinensis TaxID=1286938 RepID=A0ABW1C2Y1_9ACTN|nr:ABC transporter ATP-binding protein [Nonomuraea harbinensis]
MRAIARKRGFGIFTTIAGPSLKEVVWSESDSPNFTIKNELSPAQLAAYDTALESCRAQAVKKVTGQVVRSAEDLAEQRNQMIDQTLDRELNGDPELIELAAAMGDCLKGKGYRIDSVRPADIGRQVPDTFEEQLKRIALNDDIPEEGIGEGRYIVPRLAPATARQWADKEIKAALDDVECGKDFYAAYEPRTVIELRAITKEFPSRPPVRALDDVSFRVDRGDYVAIVGPSGSGKSTLLNVLGLLDRPTTGSYRLDGTGTTALKDGARTKLRGDRIGFVFQSFHLLPHRSLTENVMLAEVYGGRPRRGRRERALAALERVGLGHRTGFPAGRLSGGERQRAAIARALMGEPALLLCDEPTGNLDSRNTEAVLSLFAGLRTQGLTIVVITHEREVSERAERRVRITDGMLTEA